MLVHDFYQVEPKKVMHLDEDKLCEYVMANKGELKHTTIPDEVVRRNLGRTDKAEFCALDIEMFAPEKMKYFSSFLNTCTENKTIGLNYYGITLMNDEVLDYLAVKRQNIYFWDRGRLRKFIRFMNDARQTQKWIVHYGI